MTPFRLSIRWQLAVQLTAAVLPLAGLIGYNIYAGALDSVQREADASSRLAGHAAQSVEQFLEDSRHALESAARWGERLLDPVACGAIAATFHDLNPAYANLVVRDRDDRAVCGARVGAGLPETARDPESFARTVAENRFTVGKPLLGPITGRWVSILRQPIRDAAGRVIGVINLPIDLARLQPLITAPELPKGGVVVLTTRDGTVLARSSDAEKWVGRNARDGGAAAEFFMQPRGQVRARAMDGVERVYGFTTVPQTDWIVASGIPVTLVYGPARDRALRSMIVFLLILAAAGVLVWAIGRSLARPVLALAEAARAVAGGRVDARAPERGPREIATVSAQFNRMLDALASANAGLRASEERYRRIVETTLEGVYVVDADYRIRFANRRMLDLLGYAREELLGRTPLDLLSPESRAVAQASMARRRGGHAEQLELEYQRRDGTTLWGLLSASPLLDDVGRFAGAVGMITDITERRRAQAELSAANARLRALARRLTETEESERRKINHELHDRVASGLSAAALGLSAALSRLAAADPAGVAQPLAEVQRLLVEITRQSRDLMAELSPPALEEFGLLAALQSLGDAVQARASLRVEVRGAAPEPRPSLGAETALFRIAQEALTNAAKHSGAERAQVRLERAAGKLVMSVDDAGAGFDPAGPKAGWGLRAMRERAEAIGADLRIHSAPGKGTRIVVTLDPQLA